MARPVDVRKHQLWRQRFLRFQSSKLSVVEFCRSENISQASFYQWRRKLADALPDQSPKAKGSSPTAHFVPVEVINTGDLHFTFPNGVDLRIEAGDQRLLQAVIDAVAVAKVTQGDC
jgi:hypothetical protein